MNGPFQEDWTKRLMGPQSTAAYQGALSQLGARQTAPARPRASKR